jgi:hypothetical protein
VVPKTNKVIVRDNRDNRRFCKPYPDNIIIFTGLFGLH